MITLEFHAGIGKQIGGGAFCSEEGFLGQSGNVSKIGKTYLDFLEREYGLNIQREVKYHRYRIDGFVEDVQQRIDHPLFAHVSVHARLIIEINGRLYNL